MSTGADRIAQDINDIVHTRVAIAEKLEAIEHHVGTTLHHARTMMTDVADKTTSSLRETIEATRGAVDPHVHASRHPWIFVGGALVLGYAVGTFSRNGWRTSTRVVPYYPPGAKSAGVMPANDLPKSERDPGVYPFYSQSSSSNTTAEHSRENQGWSDHHSVWTELERAFQDELGTVRTSVIRFGRGLLREMVRQAIPTLVHMLGDTRRERAPHSDRNRVRR